MRLKMITTSRSSIKNNNRWPDHDGRSDKRFSSTYSPSLPSSSFVVVPFPKRVHQLSECWGRLDTTTTDLECSISFWFCPSISSSGQVAPLPPSPPSTLCPFCCCCVGVPSFRSLQILFLYHFFHFFLLNAAKSGTNRAAFSCHLVFWVFL